MPVELTEIAAGLPFAASFAMATGITALRESRRRTSLNEAMHELRRPLQALALSLAAKSRDAEASESALRMTAAALERLDREINGGAAETAAERVPVRPLIEAALACWRPRALAAGRSLKLVWAAVDPVLHGHGPELAQAVDNLISNGFEHGSGTVEIRVREAGGRLTVTVRNGGGRNASARSWRLRGRPRPRRHGHGLRIVRRAAARHGGDLRLATSAGVVEARLALPLAEAGR